MSIPTFEEKTLVIVRGLPGSGKSTLSKLIAKSNPTCLVCSTDNFFVDETGQYVFDRRKLKQAHTWNQEMCRSALDEGVLCVVVDNTNTMKWEAKLYVEMAVDRGYSIKVVETNTPWRYEVEQLAEKNKHGVPSFAIARMLERWEPTSEWNQQSILASLAPHAAKQRRAKRDQSEKNLDVQEIVNRAKWELQHKPDVDWLVKLKSEEIPFGEFIESQISIANVCALLRNEKVIWAVKDATELDTDDDVSVDK